MDMLFAILFPIGLSTLGLALAIYDSVLGRKRESAARREPLTKGGGSARRKPDVLSSSSDNRLTNTLGSISSIQEDKSLSQEETTLGLKNLNSILEQVEPSYVVGLNRGGVLVGAYLSLASELPSERFERCCVIKEGARVTKVECNFRELSGEVLVIDDILRSGHTMKAAISEILKLNPEIKRIYSATLVATVDSSGSPIGYSDLSFCSFTKPRHVDVRLPWSDISVFEKIGDPRFSEVVKQLKITDEIKLSLNKKICDRAITPRETLVSDLHKIIENTM